MFVKIKANGKLQHSWAKRGRGLGADDHFKKLLPQSGKNVLTTVSHTNVCIDALPISVEHIHALMCFYRERNLYQNVLNLSVQLKKQQKPMNLNSKN